MKRLRTIALIAIAALVGLYLAWVAAATWFIRDGIYRVNDWNTEVDLSMGFAVSWLPGHISGRDLRIVVHDSDAELDLQFARFDLVVDVAQLPHKRFVTSKTYLEGVKFYYRAPRKIPELCTTKGLPRIGNLAVPPPTENCLQQSETVNADTAPSPPSDLWQVDLSNIEIREVTDVWLDQYRLRGRGTVGESNFYLWPAQKIMVDGRTSHWSALQVDFAGEEIIQHGGADLSVKIDMVPTKDNAVIWHATTGTIALRNLDGRLERFHYFAGSYRLGGEAIIDHGQPTLIAAHGEVPNLTMHVGDKKLTGAFDVHIRGQPAHAPKTLRIGEGVSRLSNIAIDGKAFPQDEVHARILPGGVFHTTSQRFDFEVAATCNTIEPAKALLPPSFGADLTKLIVPDEDQLTMAIHFEGPWDHMIAEPFTVRGGGLNVGGEMELSPELKGKFKASIGPVSKTIEID